MLTTILDLLQKRDVWEYHQNMLGTTERGVKIIVFSDGRVRLECFGEVPFGWFARAKIREAEAVCRRRNLNRLIDLGVKAQQRVE